MINSLKFSFFRLIALLFISGAVSAGLISCDPDESEAVSFGTVSGTVSDESGNPISGVTVAVSDVDATATTGSDGKYSVENVSLKSHAVTFSKSGWLTVSKTVTLKDFVDGKAVANVAMVNASAKITGKVTDAKNGGAPLAGVDVSIGAAGSAVTGSDGSFAIENLLEDDYTVTFSKANYVSVNRAVKKSDFVGGTVTLTVEMGSVELLRGLTADDLASADKWYYNEYRGGGNADAYPHWDWACDYMCGILSFVGDWEEQWEGTTLRTRNDAANQSNPADLDVFDSFTYGSKKITNDNKIMSVRLRTHNADAAAPAYFGVQVIDLSAAQPEAVRIGDIRTYGSENYADFDFDLGAYVGKEVIIAIGIYRQQTGDYWKQLVLRAIRFSDIKVEGTGWLPGTEVIPDWKLSIETVRSTMPHLKKHFSGISPMSAGRDVSMTTGYPAAYRAWRDVSHIGVEWEFMPIKKDPEPFPSEGYLIKTRGSDAAVNTIVPEAYMYSKFSIAAGSNQLTLKTRNFSSSDYTYFKLTAIKDDGTVVHVQPVSNTANDASAAEDGCWKFKHESGGAGSPEAYATFVYDLSQFNGSDVVLAFGVYKGASNGGENKLLFYSIDLQ
jgi:hypothetical protein